MAAHQTARLLCVPGEHIWQHFVPEDTETVAKTQNCIEDGGRDGSGTTILSLIMYINGVLFLFLCLGNIYWYILDE